MRPCRRPQPRRCCLERLRGPSGRDRHNGLLGHNPIRFDRHSKVFGRVHWPPGASWLAHWQCRAGNLLKPACTLTAGVLRSRDHANSTDVRIEPQSERDEPLSQHGVHRDPQRLFGLRGSPVARCGGSGVGDECATPPFREGAGPRQPAQVSGGARRPAALLCCGRGDALQHAQTLQTQHIEVV